MATKFLLFFSFFASLFNAANLSPACNYTGGCYILFIFLPCILFTSVGTLKTHVSQGLKLQKAYALYLFEQKKKTKKMCIIFPQNHNTLS